MVYCRRMNPHLTLYVKAGCHFCEKVKNALQTLNIRYTEKSILDDTVAEELIALGGKRQVPFLVDGDTMMYESQSIVDYLMRKYEVSPEAEKPHMHFAKGEDVCRL